MTINQNLGKIAKSLIRFLLIPFFGYLTYYTSIRPYVEAKHGLYAIGLLDGVVITVSSLALFFYITSKVLPKGQKVAPPTVVTIPQGRVLSLEELLGKWNREQQIGDTLVKLRDKFGEGFQEMDVYILDAIGKGKKTFGDIAIFINKDEKDVMKRLEFLAKKGVIKY